MTRAATVAERDPGAAPAAPGASCAVSFVLAPRGGAALTARCLDALARLPQGPSFEVVLVERAPDESPTLPADLPAEVLTIRPGGDLGWGAACDRAVRLARGEHVVLLQDDVVPCDGWLRPLLDRLAADPTAGIARPRHRDDRGKEVRDPAWGCLALRRSAFEAVGGFGGTAQPGRAEKHALLAAIRDRGWRSLEVPESVVLLVADLPAPPVPAAAPAPAAPAAPTPAAAAAPPASAAPPRVVAAYADEVVADPDLLRAFREAAGRDPETSLVLYAPDRDEAQACALVAPALALAGLDEDDGPDVVLLCVAAAEGDPALAGKADALLTRVAPAGALATLPRVAPEQLGRGHGDLIYDVGMNNGDDTAYYLAQGLRVVAVEANPRLAAEGRERFAREIAEGRLVLLNVGVADRRGVLPFYVNEDNDDWSSFVREVGWRQGTRGHQVDVEVVPFGEILAAHGVPRFLKIDIEFYDRHCLLALHDLAPEERPEYVSVEAHDVEYLCLLQTLGYDDFKLVDQRGHNWPGRKVATHFAPGASGPVGESSYGDWESLETVFYEYLHFKRGHAERMELPWSERVEPRFDWFDFHARRT